MIDYSNQGVVWYAMKTVYKKELQAKEYLDKQGIENFIPMSPEIITKNSRKKLAPKPLVHNLIFVKTDLVQLNEVKLSLNYLHNRLYTDSGVSYPIIVPTKQMEQFIDAITNHSQEVTYIDLSEACLEKGTPVRITDGKFKGYEGELEKVKGKRDRLVHVIIKGVAAYKFETKACYVEKI